MKVLYCSDSQERIPDGYFREGKAFFCNGKPYLKTSADRLQLISDLAPPHQYLYLFLSPAERALLTTAAGRPDTVGYEVVAPDDSGRKFDSSLHVPPIFPIPDLNETVSARPSPVKRSQWEIENLPTVMEASPLAGLKNKRPGGLPVNMDRTVDVPAPVKLAMPPPGSTPVDSAPKNAPKLPPRANTTDKPAPPGSDAGHDSSAPATIQPDVAMIKGFQAMMAHNEESVTQDLPPLVKPPVVTPQTAPKEAAAPEIKPQAAAKAPVLATPAAKTPVSDIARDMVSLPLAHQTLPGSVKTPPAAVLPPLPVKPVEVKLAERPGSVSVVGIQLPPDFFKQEKPAAEKSAAEKTVAPAALNPAPGKAAIVEEIAPPSATMMPSPALLAPKPVATVEAKSAQPETLATGIPSTVIAKSDIQKMVDAEKAVLAAQSANAGKFESTIVMQQSGLKTDSTDVDGSARFVYSIGAVQPVPAPLKSEAQSLTPGPVPKDPKPMNENMPADNKKPDANPADASTPGGQSEAFIGTVIGKSPLAGVPIGLNIKPTAPANPPVAAAAPVKTPVAAPSDSRETPTVKSAAPIPVIAPAAPAAKPAALPAAAAAKPAPAAPVAAPVASGEAPTMTAGAAPVPKPVTPPAPAAVAVATAAAAKPAPAVPATPKVASGEAPTAVPATAPVAKPAVPSVAAAAVAAAAKPATPAATAAKPAPATPAAASGEAPAATPAAKPATPPAAAAAAAKPATPAAAAAAPAKKEPARILADIDIGRGEKLSAEELAKIKIFEGIPINQIERLPGAVVKRVFKKGEIVCYEGEYGSTAFYILKGKVDVYINTPLGKARKETPEPGGFMGLFGKIKNKLVGKKKSTEDRRKLFIPVDGPVDLDMEKPIAQLLENDLFGEMSCLSFYPRSATVRAAEECEMLEMLRPVLQTLQKNKQFKEQLEKNYRERALGQHLRSIPLFANTDDQFIDQLKSRVQLEDFDPDDVIFKQGDESEAFYLIRVGCVKVTQSHPGGELVVSYLGRGEFFGEAGLLRNAKRATTCTALDHVELVKIKKKHFDFMLSWYEGLTKEFEKIMETREQEVNRMTSRAPRMPLDDFLGQGLMHAQSLLLLDLEKCTRCDECVRACADSHGGVTRLVREGLRFDKYLVPSSCRSCMDPVCMIGCPVGSIRRKESLEIIIEDWCIGCGICAKQCPYGNITMHSFSVDKDDPEKPGFKKAEMKEVAVTCDLCTELSEPSCVYACPHDAAHRVNARDFFVTQSEKKTEKV